MEFMEVGGGRDELEVISALFEDPLAPSDSTFIVGPFEESESVRQCEIEH
jgi:hypothetical protein